MTKSRHQPRSALREFLESEAAGGILLMIAAILAMLVANSPWSSSYFEWLHEKAGPLSVHHWINDALMAIFFLLVGLEIKREFVDGHLATWADRRLPVIAAAAGMVVPAIVYLGVTQGNPALARGWAIPAATDIAFAIGVLALLGSRAPASLKLFLTTVAIVDDMGAVAIIALAYTDAISGAALLAALVIMGAMMALNRGGFVRLRWYLPLAGLLWVAVFLSGVHATIAGVLAALTIPIKPTPGAPDAESSPLHRLEHLLQKPVAFGIVPLFGFANAGVSLTGIGASALLGPLPLGVALGLFAGKQLGIFSSVWLSVKFGLADQPAHASWRQVYGVSLLCGIGFTMSLFIGGLAFNDPAMGDSVKIGVLMGSVLAAVSGYALLRSTASRPRV
jgi:NhaA family Na+:H+ antiporter